MHVRAAGCGGIGVATHRTVSPENPSFCAEARFDFVQQFITIVQLVSSEPRIEFRLGE